MFDNPWWWLVWLVVAWLLLLGMGLVTAAFIHAIRDKIESDRNLNNQKDNTR